MLSYHMNQAISSRIMNLFNRHLKLCLCHLLVSVFILVSVGAAEIFLDVNSYLQYSSSRGILHGAEDSITFRFRFCNDKGMLIYQNGGAGFFALGVNSGKIYIEWSTSDTTVEVIHS